MKRVEFNKPQTVNINDIDAQKIYAFKTRYGGLFKLHRLGTEGWAMISLVTSTNWAAGSHLTAAKALKASSGDEIYEFTGLQEFLKWALE